MRYVLNKADEHFCKHCISKGKAKCNYKKVGTDAQQPEIKPSYDTCSDEYNSFIEDGFCINKTMYATRVITSHLNYLDQYRMFMWEKLGSESEESYIIQSIILEQMEKYLDFWNNRRVWENKRLYYIYRDNVTEAKKLLKTQDYISIEIENAENNDQRIQDSFA